MQYKRWYDKNEALKKIMEILESSDPITRENIANDIIQLIVNKQYDVDNFIRVINSQTPPRRTRWYDEDETIYSAVEMLKNTNESEKKELFREVLATIYSFDEDNYY